MPLLAEWAALWLHTKGLTGLTREVMLAYLTGVGGSALQAQAARCVCVYVCVCACPRACVRVCMHVCACMCVYVLRPLKPNSTCLQGTYMYIYICLCISFM